VPHFINDPDRAARRRGDPRGTAMSTTEHHHAHAHDHCDDDACAPGPVTQKSPPASEPEPGPNLGVHGMLVLGGEDSVQFISPVYVSHLPMFMSPHDFQVIVRVGGDATDRYVPHRSHFGAPPYYSFEPEQFSIDELDPAGDGPRRTSFGGTLYRGHFERKGSAIARDVAFDVEQVIFFRRFDPRAKRGDLRYLCFGTRDVTYMAHLISAPPDFDQVIRVELGALDAISDDELRAGVVLTVPGREDEVDSRLVEGDAFAGEVRTQDGAGSGTIELTVGREYYLETGDLAARM
jgi:hypothetical protein